MREFGKTPRPPEQNFWKRIWYFFSRSYAFLSSNETFASYGHDARMKDRRRKTRFHSSKWRE